MKKSKTKKKIDLAAEADTGSKVKVKVITDDMLIELAPKEIKALFKKAKTAAARADLLFSIENNELKELRKKYKELGAFVSSLSMWFIQEFKDDQKGVTGKLARAEVKSKEVPKVVDWKKFYKHIVKTNEFDLLNKAANKKALKERWEQKKNVPGVDKFGIKVLSLTKAKEKK